MVMWIVAIDLSTNRIVENRRETANRISEREKIGNTKTAGGN